MEKQQTVLIVEDEKNIVDILRFNLQKEGYATLEALDGVTGLRLALDENPDLILLDLMLPEMNGFEVCKLLRDKGRSTPVLIITAREEEKDKILGLDTGADDYVTKPFSFKELMSRIRANIRRTSGEIVREQRADAGVITIGELVIDRTHYLVTKSGEPIELSKKDYDFIAFLAVNVGKAYSREQLLEEIWGYDEYYGDIRTVDVTVFRIRSKIEADPSHPEYLMTKRGVGYYLAKH